jgi:hypothetical protein
MMTKPKHEVIIFIGVKYFKLPNTLASTLALLLTLLLLLVFITLNKDNNINKTKLWSNNDI